jgi:hypothetical protein
MTEAVLLPFNFRPRNSSFHCVLQFLLWPNGTGFPKGFKILARFAGICSSLRRLFFPFSAGRSISDRSSFISVQSSRETSSRRNPVKAQIAKNGNRSRSRADKNALISSGVNISTLPFRLTRNGSNPSSGFAARTFAFVAMLRALLR